MSWTVLDICSGTLMSVSVSTTVLDSWGMGSPLSVLTQLPAQTACLTFGMNADGHTAPLARRISGALTLWVPKPSVIWTLLQCCSGIHGFCQRCIYIFYHISSISYALQEYTFQIVCIWKVHWKGKRNLCGTKKLHHEENESILSKDNKIFASIMHCCNEILCYCSHILSQFRNLTC